jgi:hypothetical protein
MFNTTALFVGTTAFEVIVKLKIKRLENASNDQQNGHYITSTRPKPPQRVPPPKTATLTHQITTETAVAAAGDDKRGSRRVFLEWYVFFPFFNI